MNLLKIEINICQACLDGKGSECHTAGCALFLHRVDLPIMPELYKVLDEQPADESIAEWRECPMCGKAGAFKIDATDPSRGYCRLEDSEFMLSPGNVAR